MSRAFLILTLYVLWGVLLVGLAGCGPVDTCSCGGDRCTCPADDGRCVTIRQRGRNGQPRCFPEDR